MRIPDHRFSKTRLKDGQVGRLERVTSRGPTWRARDYAQIILLTVAGLGSSSCHSDSYLSFLDAQGSVAQIQRGHFLDMVTALVIFVAVPVFTITPWFAWRYRYRTRAARYTPKWHIHNLLNIACWGGPMVIVALLGNLLWGSTHTLDPYRALVSDQPALRVQVIGYDWKWLFIYPDEGVASIGELAIVAGRPVAFELTSATVMQSFLIPALGSQISAMGGMVTQLNLEAAKVGRFMGENTMYNGNGFSQQKFTAVAMTPSAFQTWVGNARVSGTPMTEETLNAISKRTTRVQLIAAVGNSKSIDGNLYFSGATAALFPEVVRATMEGTAVKLVDVVDGEAVEGEGGKRTDPMMDRNQ